MGIGIPGVRAALRIARRDAMRAKGRTVLVAAMIGLPVLLVSAADVVARSATDGPDQIVWRQLGTYQELQALVHVWTPGYPVAQNPDATVSGQADENQPPPSEPPDPDQTKADLLATVPAGDRILTEQYRYGSLFRVGGSNGGPDRGPDGGTGEGTGQGTGGARSVRADLRQADWSEPSFAGLVELTAGRLPKATGEVAVTSAFANHTDVEVGDEMRLEDVGVDSDAPVLKVVGVARVNADSLTRTVLSAPGLIPSDEADVNSYGSLQAYIVGPTPVTWTDVRRLNSLGAVVVSRAVLADPPPASEVPPVYANGTNISAEVGIVVVTVGGLALLEVALLAGPAFAVGARRNLRHLALVLTSGGDRRHIRNIVLAGGLVIGLGASAVGAVLGAGVGVAALPVLEHYERGDFAHTDIRLADLTAIVVVGTLTAIAAAVVPAWQASKLDVVAALAGRRGQTRPRKRVPVIGAAALVVGAGLALLGAASLKPLLVLTGTAIATLGLVATAGALVALVARLARRLTLAPRIALRDAARQRGRTAPAVGAVMAAVTGSVSISLYVAALDNHDRLEYQPSAAPGGVVTDLSRYGPTGDLPPNDPAPVEALLRANLPIEALRRVGVLATADGVPRYAYPELRTDVSCPDVGVSYADSPAGIPASTAASAPADERCRDPEMITVLNTVIVDDGSAVDVASGGAYPDVRAAVGDGLVAVTNPQVVQPSGTVVLKVQQPYDLSSSQSVNGTPTEDTLVLPARLVERDGGTAIDIVVVPPAVASANGFRTVPGALVASTTQLPTEAQAERATAALSDAGINNYLVVERGYESRYEIGLLALAVAAGAITLGATGIAVGLAAADGRADLATLAAVGASPGLRRRLAASQAAVIALLGAVMGVLAGAVPGVAVVWMRRHSGLGFDPTWEFVVPWTNLLTIVVVVPVVAVTCGWLFTRSRLPMVRRTAL